MARHRILAPACALAALAGCQPSPAPSPMFAPVLGDAPVDLAAIVARAKRSFRTDDRGEHRAAGAGWRARVGRDGGLEFAPEGGAPRTPAAPLILAAPRFSRGNADLGGMSAPARVDSQGALVRSRGGAEERMAGAERGLELTWTFQARPSGAGPLAVRLATSGAPLLASSASGLHFGAPGAPLVRVGGAEWIDASGRATRVPARWTGGEVAFEVPGAMVDASAYPAALAPALSPEAALDVPILGGAPGQQVEPAAATDGSGWLVAWTDRRSREETWIVAARIAPDGTLLDPAGLVVASGAGERFAPAVAWGGGAYLIAWQEREGSGAAKLLGARIGPGGARLDAAPLALGRAASRPGRTAAAHDGNDFRIAWSTYEPGFGTPLGSCEVQLSVLGPALASASAREIASQSCSEATPVSLACAGENCLVAWNDGSSLSGGLFSRSGKASEGSAAGPLGFPRASAAALAYVEPGYVLAFLQSRASSDSVDLVGARIGADGAVLDKTPFPIALQGAYGPPSLAFDGARLAVAWSERRSGGSDVYGLRLLPDGTPADTSALAVAVGAGDQRSPAVAASAKGVLVAFVDTRSDADGDIYGARILPGDLPDPEGLLLSRAARRESRPAVGFDGAHWLVTFEDERAGRATGIYGLRLAADLTPLDAAPFAIADGVDAELGPAVAGCSNGFLVAWEDYRNGGADLYLKPVPAQGPPGAELAVATGEGAQAWPALACGPDGAVLAWLDSGQTSYPQRAPGLRALRLSAEGAPRDPSPLALAGPTPRSPMSAAAGAEGYEVAWQTIDAAGHSVILAARIAQTRDPAAPVVVCDGPGARGDASISADSAGYQVFFADQRSAPTRLRAARLTASGEVLDPCGIDIPGAEGAAAPAAAFDGARHVVAFQRLADGALGGASVAPGGGALGAFQLSSEPGAHRAPRMACDGRGSCLAVFEAQDASAGNGRVWLRLVASAPPAASCRSADDCASGHCVDGVCCDSPCGGGDPADCQACAVAAGAPADGICAPVAAGGLCRRGAICDVAERCDGAHAACPADAPASDGSFCDDGDLCTQLDACLAGVCAGGEPVRCAARACRKSVCAPATGRCEETREPEGTSCDDGDPCTEGDRCDASAGACRGAPKVCPHGPCSEGLCNAYTGECGQRALADGSGCDDGSACTMSDRCVSGVCQPGPAVRCPPPDACHLEGLCDRTTGSCSVAVAPDGIPCDDGDACSRSSACAAGRCVGSEWVTCPGADACHGAGACDPATGACGAPAPKADGTECDDGNACTRSDACRSGICVGGDPVACPAPNACQEPGLCNPATGHCVRVWKPAGTICDDGDACTRGDACVDGECRPGAAAVCPLPEGECLEASCSRETGECGPRPAVDGTVCRGGRCAGGVCVTPSPGKAGCGCGIGGESGSLPAIAVALCWIHPRRWRRGSAGRTHLAGRT
jgi:hypothetical protein